MRMRQRDLERRRRRQSVDPWRHRTRNVIFGSPRRISVCDIVFPLGFYNFMLAFMNPTVQTNSPASIVDSHSPMWNSPCPEENMEIHPSSPSIPEGRKQKKRQHDLEQQGRRQSVDSSPRHSGRNVPFGPPSQISTSDLFPEDVHNSTLPSLNPTVQTNSPASIVDSHSQILNSPCADDNIEISTTPSDPQVWEQRKIQRNLEQLKRRQSVDACGHGARNMSFEPPSQISTGTGNVVFPEDNSKLLPSINPTIQANSLSIVDSHSQILNSPCAEDNIEISSVPSDLEVWEQRKIQRNFEERRRSQLVNPWGHRTINVSFEPPRAISRGYGGSPVDYGDPHSPIRNSPNPSSIPRSHSNIDFIGGLPPVPSPTHSEILSMATEFSKEWLMISPIHSPADHQEEPEDIDLPPHNQVAASPPHIELNINIIVGVQEDNHVQDENPIRLRIRSVPEINRLSEDELR
ncbi:uncharacterized protein LOC129004233 [Macrosteles quadrilineatus]|uniref:uncharacterized protein LOC129004233 n=1 Tax=Macrosteles quadrilineatus TaxID=74068 RepID=UPI0023E11482|nr:uncharacterized protein LOC129004233 [Macrosteles quadrilineatus]XP_054288698.1 uncharacterized protein LOC129004233 [Macrosteles quadrilineatus]